MAKREGAAPPHPGGQLVLAGAVMGGQGAFATGDAADSCAPPDRLDIRGDWGGQARFTIELADTAGERSRGLMFRESLGASEGGMLFLYPPRAGKPAFWMKNTLIPLDMIFITPPAGVVQHVHENAIPPHDLTPISGGTGGVNAVLEIKGGMARILGGLSAGSELRHPPGFNPEIAVWPCPPEDSSN